MITGRRVLPADPGLGRASPWRLIVGVVLALIVVFFIARGLTPSA
jgi:hypothetical protein